MSRRRVILLTGGALVLLWGVFVAVAVLGARSDALAGQKLLESVEDRASEPGVLLEDDVLADVRAAARRFASAHDRLGHPLLTPARVLPFAGRQLRSFSALTGAGEEVGDIAVSTLEAAQDLVVVPPGTGPERVEVVGRLGRVAGDAWRRLAAIDLGPSSALVGPLRDARATFAGELADVTEVAANAEALAEGVVSLMDGPRRYLVAAANNAEMRAGSGMFLMLGELTTGDGQLRLGPLRSVTEAPVAPGAVEVTGDYGDRWGWLDPGEEWRNLMLSPRFEASAALAADMWEAAGNPRPDGVLAVDPLALQAIVGAVGPVEIGGETYEREGLAEFLLRGQYRAFETRTARQDALGDVAQAVFDRLDAGDWDVPDLADALADAARGRHLMLWSSDGDEQRAWEAASIDGAVHEDSLLVAVLNRGGNKLDPFVGVSATLDVGEEGENGTRPATLALQVENRAPDGLPPTITGADPAFDLAPGDHRIIVSVTLPGAARNARIEGVDDLAVAGPDGPTRVVAALFELPRGERRDVVVRFELPGTMHSMRIEPSARLPRIAWDHAGKSWQDHRMRTVRW